MDPTTEEEQRRGDTEKTDEFALFDSDWNEDDVLNSLRRGGDTEKTDEFALFDCDWNEDDVLNSLRSKPTTDFEMETLVQPTNNKETVYLRCPLAEPEDRAESTDDMDANIHEALEKKTFVSIEEAVTVKSLTSCKTNALLKAFEVNKKLKDMAEGRGPEYKEFEMLADSVGEFSTALIDPLKSDDDTRTAFEGCFDIVLHEAIQKKQKKFLSHPVIDTLLQRRWRGPFFSISKSHWTEPSFWGFLLLHLYAFFDVIVFPFIFFFCFIIEIFKRGLRKRRAMEISFLLALSEDVTEDALRLMKQSIRYLIKEYGSESPDYCLLPGESKSISFSELFTKLSTEVSDDDKPVLTSEDTIKISKASSSRFLDTLGEAGVFLKSPASSQRGSAAQMLVVFVNDFRLWQQEKVKRLVNQPKSDVLLVPVCIGDNVRLEDLNRFGSLYFGEYESPEAVRKAIIQRADGKDVFERYLEYFTTPCFVFTRDTLSYFTLLLLIFVVCLSPPTVEPSIVELVVLVFFVGRIFMEVDQFVEPKKDKTGANEHVVSKRSSYESVPPNEETSAENAEQPEKRLETLIRNFRGYFSDLWNWLDFIVLIIYVITFILRMISWVKSGPVAGNRLLAVAFYFYGFIAIVLTFRAFGHVMERARGMGAILIALIFIVRDVATIFLQFMTIILGFSFAITNVYVVERSYVSTGSTTEELACNNGGLRCWLIMVKHLGLSLLGLPEVDSFSSVDRPSVFLAEILYSLFLIIGATLLVNMLIALLSNTYQSVEDNSLNEWSFKNAVTIKTYSLYHPVPVPFNILTIPARFLFRLCKRLFKESEPQVNEELKRCALDKLLKKLGSTYFATFGYSFPLTDDRKMDELLHESNGNRRMANQISRRVFRESRIKQRMFKTGESAWESKEIQIEGCQLTCWGSGPQMRYGARYKTPFSKEMPRVEVHILESGEKRILGVGAVFKGYKTYWMPGWRHNSVGYHADHGTIFDEKDCVRGRDGDDAMAYRGDLMACEVDFDKETNESVPVKFFLNGRKVGSATVKYPNGKAQLFPFIGMGYKGIRVLVEMCPPEERSAAEGAFCDDKVKQAVKDIVRTEFKTLEDKWRVAKDEMLQAIQNERRKEKEDLRILLTELMETKEKKEKESS